MRIRFTVACITVIVAVIILLVILASLLYACSSGHELTPDTSSTTTSEIVTTTTTEPTTTTVVPPTTTSTYIVTTTSEETTTTTEVSTTTTILPSTTTEPPTTTTTEAPSTTLPPTTTSSTTTTTIPTTTTTVPPTTTTTTTTAPPTTTTTTTQPTTTTAITTTTTLPKIEHFFYVSLDGNDSNPGTIDQPWLTLNKGVSNLLPGDTLYIRSGTYKLQNTLAILRSGSPDHPIIISAFPGESVLISGDSNDNAVAESTDAPGSKYDSLVNISGSYVLLKDLEIAYSGGKIVQIDGSFDVVSGCNIHHAWDSGIYVHGSYAMVYNNNVWRSAESNYIRGVYGDWGSGIAFGYKYTSMAPGVAHHIKILNNTIHNNSGEGVLGEHSDYATIEGNVLYDNWAVAGVYLDQCGTIYLQKNLIYWTGDTFWSRYSYGAPGIMLTNESDDGGIYPVGHHINIINNFIVGTGTNILFQVGHHASSALVNTMIYHNTLVEAASYGIKIGAGKVPHYSSRISNNLVLQSSGTVAYIGNNIGLTLNYNLWSRTPFSMASGVGDYIGNPLLVNPGNIRIPGEVIVD